MKLNILTALLVVTGVVLLGRHYAHDPWTPTRIAGAFPVRPKAQQLVTHGLYSRIRNPIYFFGAITIAGLFLYIDRPLGLSFLVVVVPLQIYRAREEAKILEA